MGGVPLDAPAPVLPPDWARLNHGVSLLGGWLPAVVQIVAVLAVIAVIGWRSRRWRLVWVPVSVAIGAAGALATRTWVNSEGLASDPAPVQLWLWATVFVSLVAIAVLGWRSAGWRRRALSVVAVPLTLLAVLITLNQWVGYYPTVPAAWNALTAGPLPDEVDAEALPSLRDTTPSTGTLIEVTIPDTASGFNHRSEYVYLPPRAGRRPSDPRRPPLRRRPVRCLRRPGRLGCGRVVDGWDVCGGPDGHAPGVVPHLRRHRRRSRADRRDQGPDRRPALRR
jgi:hypothetical protein